MHIKLRILGGKHAGREIEVRERKFLIGRGEECQLRPSSELVSRHHCALLVDAAGVRLHDFGSRNGTLVNGDRIRGDHELVDGDRVTVGPLTFEVLIALPAQAAPAEAPSRTGTQNTATNQDLQVMEWLTDMPGAPRAAQKPVSLGEPVAAGDTAAMGLETTDPAGKAIDPPPAPPAARRTDTLDKPPAPRGLDKKPTEPPPKPASSSQAAADVINQFRQRSNKGP